jgi:hypothetical protein
MAETQIRHLCARHKRHLFRHALQLVCDPLGFAAREGKGRSGAAAGGRGDDNFAAGRIDAQNNAPGAGIELDRNRDIDAIHRQQSAGCRGSLFATLGFRLAPE